MFEGRRFVQNAIFLPLALRREVPERYNLSDENHNRPDFTSVMLNDGSNDARYFFTLKSKVKSLGVEVFVYDSEERKLCDGCISLPTLLQSDLTISRIYRTISIDYKSILTYIFGEAFSYHKVLYFREKATQASFERRFKPREDRNEVLRSIVLHHRQALREDEGLVVKEKFYNSVDLFTDFNGIRVWGLGNSDGLFNDFLFILDSLVEAGDLKFDAHHLSYSVSGQALTSLSKALEDDRRHRDVKTYNWLVITLTAIIALSTLIQSAQILGLVPK